jgi:hypothetical protein
MRNYRTGIVMMIGCLLNFVVVGQTKNYPVGYFRNPLNIPMELVANFGELRANHWHMGLDVRTQQRENLPVHAAAEGYISRIKIEPGGFGRAIYITHPNGYTTLYAHLNAFRPDVENWVKGQQYAKESWAVELPVAPALFPLAKGDFFAFSGNTGGSAGPHVHFEIRDTRTDNCLNPLLFGFPIRDAVPPSLVRLALYDRNKSVYAQSPQMTALKKVAAGYVLPNPAGLKVASNRISFALGAVDRFSGQANPNGIYSTRIFLDDQLQSQFILDDINYDETRYLNAQIDYRYKYNGGPWLQHLSRMPGDVSLVYTPTSSEGVLHLRDEAPHEVRIEVQDAAQNTSVLRFNVQYDPLLLPASYQQAANLLVPGYVNVFEEEDFELYTSERAVYDTVNVVYKKTPPAGSTPAEPVHLFVGAAIPTHDIVTVRLKARIPDSLKNCTVIQSVAGTRKVVTKGQWNGNWVVGKFRQFGTYQALVDVVPPTINPPPANLAKSTRLVFTPTDNFASIKRFRAEIDGSWLRFSNNGGKTWIYTFDEKFPPGLHELRVTVEDEAGNITSKTWMVTR